MISEVIRSKYITSGKRDDQRINENFRRTHLIQRLYTQHYYCQPRFGHLFLCRSSVTLERVTVPSILKAKV